MCTQHLHVGGWSQKQRQQQEDGINVASPLMRRGNVVGVVVEEALAGDQTKRSPGRHGTFIPIQPVVRGISLTTLAGALVFVDSVTHQGLRKSV